MERLLAKTSSQGTQTTLGRRLHSTLDTSAKRLSRQSTGSTGTTGTAEETTMVTDAARALQSTTIATSLTGASSTSPTTVLVVATKQSHARSTPNGMSFIHTTSLLVNLKKLAYSVLKAHGVTHVDTHGFVFVAVFDDIVNAVSAALELQARVKFYNDEHEAAQELASCVDIACGLALGYLVVRSGQDGRILGKAKASAWQLAKAALDANAGIYLASQVVSAWDSSAPPMSLLRLTERQENVSGEAFLAVLGSQGSVKISAQAPVSMSDFMREYKEAPEFFDLLLTRAEAVTRNTSALPRIDAEIDDKYGKTFAVLALGLRAPTFDSLSECISSLLERKTLFSSLHAKVRARSGMVVDNTTFAFDSLPSALAAAVELHEYLTYDTLHSSSKDVSSLFSAKRLLFTGIGVTFGKVLHVMSPAPASKTVFFQGDAVRGARTLADALPDSEAAVTRAPIRVTGFVAESVLQIAASVATTLSGEAGSGSTPSLPAHALHASSTTDEKVAVARRDAEVAACAVYHVEADNESSSLSREMNDQVFTLSLSHLEHAHLDASLVTLYSHPVATLVTDLSGFTRMTKKHGIIHFISLIHRVRQLLTPLFEDLDAMFIETEADNFIVLFPDPVKALVAAVHIPIILEAYNMDPNFVNDDDFHLKLGGVGCGYGSNVAYDSATEKFFGPPFDRAWDLGEDISSSGGVLIDKALYEVAKDSAAARGVLVFERQPEHPEYEYDGGEHYSVRLADEPVMDIGAYMPATPVASRSNLASPTKSLKAAVATLPKSFSDMVESRVNIRTSADFLDSLIAQKYMMRKTAVMVGWDFASVSSAYGVWESIKVSQSTLRALRGHMDDHNGRAVNLIVWLFDSNADAIRAVWEIRDTIAHINAIREPRERIPLTGFGIHCGTILRVDETHEVWGDPINVASKLGEDVATDTKVYISPEVYADAKAAGFESEFLFHPASVVISKTSLQYYDMVRKPGKPPSIAYFARRSHASHQLYLKYASATPLQTRSVVSIQSLYRGYAVRSGMARKLDAARKIQRVFRSYAQRRKGGNGEGKGQGKGRSSSLSSTSSSSSSSSSSSPMSSSSSLSLEAM